MAKVRILIDLDVITVALWDKNKNALEFLERMKRGEFEVYTPYSLLETLDVEKTTVDLLNEDIKDEDAALIVIASLFGLDCIATYNRKHLLNKTETINGILVENDFEKIEIKTPGEL